MSGWPTAERVGRHAAEHPYPQGGGRWLREDGHGPSFVQLRAVSGHVEIWVGYWHWPEVGLDGSFRPVDKEGNPLDLLARVAELEEQVSGLEAKLDERQEALADIADGTDNPYYDPEAIGCGLEDRGLTDCYEAAEYGWTCCQEAYRSWIEGLTATLVADPKEPTP